MRVGNNTQTSVPNNASKRKERLKELSEIHIAPYPMSNVPNKYKVTLNDLKHRNSKLLRFDPENPNPNYQSYLVADASLNPEKFVYLPVERYFPKYKNYVKNPMLKQDYFLNISKVPPFWNRPYSKREKLKWLSQTYFPLIIDNINARRETLRTKIDTRVIDTYNVKGNEKNKMLSRFEQLLAQERNLAAHENMKHVGVTIILPNEKKLRITSDNKKKLVDTHVQDPAKYILFGYVKTMNNKNYELPVFIHKDVVKKKIKEALRTKWAYRMKHWRHNRTPFFMHFHDHMDVTGDPTNDIRVQTNLSERNVQKIVKQYDKAIQQRDRKKFASRLRKGRNETIKKVSSIFPGGRSKVQDARESHTTTPKPLFKTLFHNRLKALRTKKAQQAR